MLNDRLPPFVRENYFCGEWHHASAVMAGDHPNEWSDLMNALSIFRLKKSYIAAGGGRKTKLADDFDALFMSKGWKEKKFDTRVAVDDQEYDTPTHKIDMYKNGVAIELEWNNKTEFYDRDLNNFRLLYHLRTVNVGVVVTRADELQEIFNDLGRGSSYGPSTTILSKLVAKVEGGGAGGCPVLTFGIRKSLYRENE
ncbi:BglII/BstYI family type II restriction endonuclease [Sagittula sp. MA-2]|uniref:BglII/BstYI family type II restriction endonuclease n=1 Tax=Sagittula sp. MA-2 TaxID=3048007 RepID=UPI0024C3FE48|nr:BglII/BstYI family type II restriction endonuclease [Sagittula sp. MA-2]WHZ34341.1 BglII/BstYI family type II restriction endonuclease [Sagittula sp. MA-2]